MDITGKLAKVMGMKLREVTGFVPAPEGDGWNVTTHDGVVTFIPAHLIDEPVATVVEPLVATVVEPLAEKPSEPRLLKR